MRQTSIGESAPVAAGALVESETAESGTAEPERPRGRRLGSDRFAMADSESFGLWLRHQREMRKVDLPEIAERTKISLRYLKAMEEDRFELLPGPIFAKGFLREYAKFVGLSPDEVVNYYLSSQSPEGTVAETDEVDNGSVQRPRWQGGLLLALLGLIALAAFSFLLFSYFQGRMDRQGLDSRSETAAPAPAGLGETELASRNSAPPAAPIEPHLAVEKLAPIRVTIDFIQKCWIEAVIDNDRRISELKVEGESLQISARESVVLTKLGNAGGISIQVNGLAYDLGARLGEVKSDIRIDEETVRSLEQGAS